MDWTSLLNAACPCVGKITARSVSDAGFEFVAWMTSRWRLSFLCASLCASCGSSGSACVTVQYSRDNQSRCSPDVVFKDSGRPRPTFVACIAYRRVCADRRRHYQTRNGESTRVLQDRRETSVSIRGRFTQLCSIQVRRPSHSCGGIQPVQHVYTAVLRSCL